MVRRRPLDMISERSNLIREKKFGSADATNRRKGGHYGATLTDDHTLFLLNQLREQRSRVEKRSWLSRIFRGR